MSVDIALIWAMSRNRVIGRDNGLPWRLPDDMRHFMRVTMGKPVIMGRKTFESMKAPLPGRMNIVLTRRADFQHPDVAVCADFDAALGLASAECERKDLSELMVIGGADIYALGLPQATRLYVTHVHMDVEGDVFFPAYDEGQWRCVEKHEHEADKRHSTSFTFATYERAG